MRRTIALLAVCLAGLASAQTSVPKRAKALEAWGGDKILGEWTLHGTEFVHGRIHPLTITFDSVFRFREDATGPMPESEGYDLEASWTMNGSGVPHATSYSDHDFSLINFYVMSGQWTSEQSPIKVLSEKDDTCEIALSEDGPKALVTLDGTTNLPTYMQYTGSGGTETWTYSNYQKMDGIQVPTLIDHMAGKNHQQIKIRGSKFAKNGKASYAMPPIDNTGYKFNSATGNTIEVKRVFGYLFVKPLINGKDEGWFFLDTGAEVMVIDTTLAKQLKMKTVGNEEVSGVVGSVNSDFVQGIDFRLGPASIKNASYMTLDMAPFSKALGMKFAGICGYDWISRVILDIDPTKPTTIGVYPGGTTPMPDDTLWTTVPFLGFIPCMTCQFEGDHEGLFTLDTGSGSTVDFFTPTVNKYDMMKDKLLSTGKTGGAGGSTESKGGSIDWFQFGPKRFVKPRVIFQITGEGEFASTLSAGNIGMGFLSKFRMILDYQNSRIAFTEISK
ncbi:MAG: hypothetical protein GC165_16455 [Armatimonadetes bacterium]|nr:hypothetical protein [Armatimonadota bacterium]